MTIKDRTEVKEMIHDVLSGWQAQTESYMVVTNNSLDKIEKHLEKINGTVAEQEKVINKNLPHNISLCPQKDEIDRLKEWKKVKEGEEIGVIKDEEKKIRRWIRIMELIGVIIALLGLLYGGNKITNRIVEKIDNLGVPVNVRNGEIMQMPSDSKIMFYPKDFTDSVK